METNTLLGMFPCSTDLDGSNHALLNSEGSLGHLRKWCDKWVFCSQGRQTETDTSRACLRILPLSMCLLELPGSFFPQEKKASCDNPPLCLIGPMTTPLIIPGLSALLHWATVTKTTTQHSGILPGRIYANSCIGFHDIIKEASPSFSVLSRKFFSNCTGNGYIQRDEASLVTKLILYAKEERGKHPFICLVGGVSLWIKENSRRVREVCRDVGRLRSMDHWTAGGRGVCPSSPKPSPW